MPYHCNGFSLIEMLITLSIIAILIVIGYPAYQHQVATSKRHHARIALVQLAARLEAYRSLSHTYATASPSALGLSNLNRGLAYQLGMRQAGTNHYVIQAIPNQQQRKQDSCGTLSLSSTGVRTASGRGGADHCWR